MKKIIIHGGCGAREDKSTSFLDYHNHLIPILEKAQKFLEKTDNALETVIYTACLLEDDKIFNAGTGSRLQQDGQIRMSSSIMDSENNKFAGIINIQNVKNPIKIAGKLLNYHHSLLCGNEATNFAYNELKEEKYNPMTKNRYEEYLDCKKGKTGTIGVVVLDSKNRICAGTSTGGAGFETPGRVSDSASVAGNFASKNMGISCTGIGEHIMNEAVASKIHTRIKDGMTLQKAVDKSIYESDILDDYVGLIALDKYGNISYGSTSIAQTLFAYYDGLEIKTFYDIFF